MKANMGTADKTIRLLLALLFASLTFTKVVEGISSYILLALAAVFVLTSAFSICPLYKLFGINTCKRQHA